jgi:hypothetical protein
MRRLRDKLESQTFEENLLRLKVTTVIVITVYTLFALTYFAIFLAFQIVKTYYPQVYGTHIELFDALMIIRACVKLPLDLYMMSSFLSTFWFMKELKKQNQSDELTPYNKRVIIATYVLLALDLFNSLISAFCYTMYNLSFFKEMPDALFVLKIFVQPVSQSLNMITLIGLLYLFYC